MTLSLLSPELFLTAVALVLLLGETFPPRLGRAWAAAAGIALVAAVPWVLRVPEGATGMFVVDGMSRFLKAISLVGVLIVLALSVESKDLKDRGIAWGTYASLLLFSTVGLMLLISAADFLTLIVGLELVSVTSFILTGFVKGDKRGSEAAIKYFLVGAFSAGIMIYGISIYYGLFGTTALEALRAADMSAVPKLPLAGAVFFLLVGFGFKVAMAPFHMWVPDVYEGAPIPVAAYISVAPKAAAFGALMRALPDLGAVGVASAVAVLAAVTMTVGNVAALRQTNVKRLLGYSSIAQMGYVLLGVVAGGKDGSRAALTYLLAYLFMNLGAFACVTAVVNEAKTEDLDGFSGLAQRSFYLALATTVFLLSLTGLPPMVGFIGKFSLFAALINHGWVWLAVVGAVNGVISLYYYFGLVHRMFFKTSPRTESVPLAAPLAGAVFAALFVTLGAGLFPDNILAWVQSVIP